ncbi:MAG TPA: SGNH/GDSL hydrolase family protein [Pseudonocardiaceae bacterium]|jgi:lysophospholipase L1-like esterase|nr:SGNH/GDSL hydrolase family protein [Pseudonocardiaceae bacterium]
MIGYRGFRTAAVVAGAVGGLSGAAYGLLTEQAKQARTVIGRPEAAPLNADGVYLPDRTGPHPFGTGPDPLRFGVVGDSSAAGLGVDLPHQLPGTLLAAGLAEEADRPVLLTTYAISGSTTRDLPDQVDRALADPPTVALVIIGANDVTDRLSVRDSARLLGVQLERLCQAGVNVVVGTCPDLGAIRPIPWPLRSVAQGWSLLLARAQRAAVERAGCVPVSLAALLSPEFFARPDDLFSPDKFHPNAAGYEAAAAVLLAPVCSAAGVWSAERAARSQQEQADRLTAAALADQPTRSAPLQVPGRTLATG